MYDNVGELSLSTKDGVVSGDTYGFEVGFLVIHVILVVLCGGHGLEIVSATKSLALNITSASNGPLSGPKLLVPPAVGAAGDVVTGNRPFGLSVTGFEASGEVEVEGGMVTNKVPLRRFL